MRDERKSKKQLVDELAQAREQIASLQRAGINQKDNDARTGDSDADYQSIFDAANDALLVHDKETGDIIDVNRRMCEMYGYTKSEARRLNVEALSAGEPPFTQEQALGRIRKAAQGEPQLFEWMAKDKAGRLFWVEVNLKMAVIGGKDRLLAIVRDIAERKQVEEALLEEKEKAQRYFNIAGVMLVVLDADQRVTLINRKGCEVLGFKQEEIIGKKWFDTFVPENVREETLTVFKNLMAGKVRLGEYFENPVLTRNKEERIIAWHNSVLTDEAGKIIGTLSSGEDITDRKRAEYALREAKEQLETKVKERTDELRRKNEELERFTYSASHDLQAPLRVIQNHLQTLIADPGEKLDDKHREELMDMGRVAENMNRLIGDMLDYARLGIRNFSMTDVSLDSIINYSQFELIDDIQKSGAEIIVSGPMPVVKGHERTLVRLMTNLLSNAIKFVQPGTKPIVRIEAGQSANRVRVSIRDNGIGIPPECGGKIFGMFERLHSQDDYPGTGVGLATAKKAVELHGGVIGVESQLGKGSTFWFELPR